jgi:multimeric flavodoxin WrbA
VRRLTQGLSTHQLLELSELDIAPFDYADPQRRDGFDTVVDAMLGSRAIVFASPVYWYAMSGPMKVLFDRLTDLLLTSEGRLRGRALAGREVCVLATGTDPGLPACFTEPFRLTAEYFDMDYAGAWYVRCGKDAAPSEAALASLDELAARLERA